MNSYLPYLEKIRSDGEAMTAQLIEWASINSGSDNVPGLDRMHETLAKAFAKLGGVSEAIPLEARIIVTPTGTLSSQLTGKALRIKKRPEAPIQIFLGGHMDTVYSTDNPFQSVEYLSKSRLRGPGVADMKGGLVVMLKVLESLEGTPWASKIGWEVLINPDEEVGSLSSEYLFIEGARRNHLGLLFEPAFSDGSVVSSRKGSGNFALVSRGKAAHAGRDFHQGRNAIIALAQLVTRIDQLNNREAGITVNIGHISGGGATNIVPDLAICKFNVRVELQPQMDSIRLKIKELVEEAKKSDGIVIEFYDLVVRGPKPMTPSIQGMLSDFKSCASELSINLEWRPSGGVCDGNTLAEAGLPNIDTLGVVGGNLHTHEEYVDLESLTERACLTSLFLMKLANGEILLPEGQLP